MNKIKSILLLFVFSISFTKAIAVEETHENDKRLRLVDIAEKVSNKIKKPIMLESSNIYIDYFGEDIDKIDFPKFREILRAHSRATYEKNGIITVTLAKDLKVRAVPFTDDFNANFDPNEIVSAVIDIEHVSAVQLLSITRTLTPISGHYTVFGPTNTVLIVDYWDNLQRLHKIIKRMDVDVPEERKQFNKKFEPKTKQ